MAAREAGGCVTGWPALERWEALGVTCSEMWAQARQDAPVDAPVYAPVEAPVDAPVEAPQSDQGSPHPRRRGYVRAASGYLYNSLPSLSGSASLNSTPLKQG